LSSRARSKLGPNVRRPPRTNANAKNDQYTRKSFMNCGGTGLSICVTLWPSSSSSAAVLSVSSPISGLASRSIDCVHMATRSRCLPGWVMSPIAGSFGFRVTRSISR
jgi:hypothetical protein